MGSNVAFSTSTGACISEGRFVAGSCELGAPAPAVVLAKPRLGRGRNTFFSRFSICAAFASLDEFPCTKDANRTLLVSRALWLCSLLRSRERRARNDPRYCQPQDACGSSLL